MRAIVARSIGGPEVLRLAEIPDPPPPAPGEALVEIEAAGVVVATGPGVDATLLGARMAYFHPRASGS